MAPNAGAAKTSTNFRENSFALSTFSSGLVNFSVFMPPYSLPRAIVSGACGVSPVGPSDGILLGSELQTATQ
jgi:hypothetical protein